MRNDQFAIPIDMAKSTSLAKVDSGTLANISIVLFVGVLAIVHLKAVVQPLVIATLLFLLIRPPANWLEQRFGHPLLAYGGLLTIFGFITFFSFLIGFAVLITLIVRLQKYRFVAVGAALVLFASPFLTITGYVILEKAFAKAPTPKTITRRGILFLPN